MCHFKPLITASGKLTSAFYPHHHEVPMALPPNIKELFLATVQYKALFSQPSCVITSLSLQNPLQDTFAFQSH